MLRYENVGYTIDINLPSGTKYEGYTAECQYRFDKEKEKFVVTMWIKKAFKDFRHRIATQKVDCQYVSGTRETIRTNLCRICDQACKTGFFDPYIEKLEHVLRLEDSLIQEESSQGAHTNV